MTSENTITGRNGKLVVGTTQVARLKQWNVNSKLATKSEWGDSDSAGFTNRAAGRKDATFTAEGVYDTTNEAFDLFQPEDLAVGALWLDNVSRYWAFPRALNDDFGLLVNVDSEEVIGWNAGFGADGIYYFPGEAGAPVYTL